jgi:WD40 repeat protein
MLAGDGASAVAQGPAKSGDRQPGGKPATRVFVIPAGAKVVKDRQEPKERSGIWWIQKGGSVKTTGGSGLYFVEEGGSLTSHGGWAIVVVKKGGRVKMMGGLDHLYYEKGAELDLLGDPRVPLAYDRITLVPFKPFTLSGTVTQTNGRPAEGIKVHVFGLGGRYLDTTATAADGSFRFRPSEEAAWLVADFGDSWGKLSRPGSPTQLGFRQRLRPLKGWEATVLEGAWTADATVRITHPGEGALTVKELRRVEGRQVQFGPFPFSADGRLLITSGDDRTLSVWDLDTGKRVLNLSPSNVHDAAPTFSPDGTLVARAGKGEGVELWQLATGKKVQTLRGHKGPVTALTFTPDGKTLISGGEDGTVRTWDVATGQERKRFQAHQITVRCLALAPDGRTLATGGCVIEEDGMVRAHVSDALRLWDLPTGRELRKFSGQNQTLAFGPGGRLLAWGGIQQTTRREGNTYTTIADDVIGLTDASTGTSLMRTMRAGYYVAFTPDGRLLVSAGGNQVTFWEVATGQPVLRVPLPVVYAAAATASPNADRVAADCTDGIRIWDLTWASLYSHRPASKPADWEPAWKKLIGADAAEAYDAIQTLASGRDGAVAFLRERLRPAPVQSLPLDRLVADLGSARFAVREAASRELKKIGAPAELTLRQALVKGPPLETRQRIEGILSALVHLKPSAEELRQLRAVVALERIATTAARRLLEALAGGWVGARQTDVARQAVTRLSDGKKGVR